jgi:hypothetical protein
MEESWQQQNSVFLRALSESNPHFFPHEVEIERNIYLAAQAHFFARTKGCFHGNTKAPMDGAFASVPSGLWLPTNP